MWGVFGLGLSYFIDAWSKNTPENVDATRKFYAREKELAQMEHWERLRSIVVEKQKAEGFGGNNMYRTYFVQWEPSNSSKYIWINKFETLINEAYWKSDLPLEVFIAEYTEERFDEYLTILNDLLYFSFNMYDKRGNAISCSVHRNYSLKDEEKDDYYDVKIHIRGAYYDRIPRRK